MDGKETHIKLIECPRDAMQGWKNFIPTQKKIEYINQLLKVGFDTIDFGSFVSAKAIPQMADTKEVISHLSMSYTKTKLLAIIANVRGAEEAAQYDLINYLGFPFSISPTFQMRNTNSTIEQSLQNVNEIKNICDKNKKEPVIYISMAFGNPYKDDYNENIVLEWIDKLIGEGIQIISLADTVGIAEPLQVASVTKKVIAAFPQIETGVHLHSTNRNWQQKIHAALEQGCRRFDGALKGIGGCPMADDKLVGNMDSELMIQYFKELGYCKDIDADALKESIKLAGEIFG
ncbi:hydroxymethylglutaryl-CoA lyase [Ginsengibacter hankyongi]|uniref:Hydroxymethylglutaryl-CoA lyase n=1 Tax=Ginsengibacter hankyongi TaxID=2607284 RepID=A0A5J5IA91_9BACT|nr:hydroxymethylglutaryl-CoA lyase [Ginsengibacter hankyongi]KAA9034659.1 hydroxymethylglutaryl-CoA lyase [Ginsengibacter hankyongi]